MISRRRMEALETSCEQGMRAARQEDEKLAGAEGFEPSPSSLTVRCPTGWTTPQQLGKTPQMRAEQHDSGHACARRLRPLTLCGKESSKITRPARARR